MKEKWNYADLKLLLLRAMHCFLYFHSPVFHARHCNSECPREKISFYQNHRYVAETQWSPWTNKREGVIKNKDSNLLSACQATWKVMLSGNCGTICRRLVPVRDSWTSFRMQDIRGWDVLLSIFLLAVYVGKYVLVNLPWILLQENSRLSKNVIFISLVARFSFVCVNFCTKHVIISTHFNTSSRCVILLKYIYWVYRRYYVTDTMKTDRDYFIVPVLLLNKWRLKDNKWG
jgi:hypothetical protein